MLLSPAELVLVLAGMGTRCCVRQASTAALQSLALLARLGHALCVLLLELGSCRTFVLGMSELHGVNRTAASRESSPGVGKSLLRAHR